MFIASRTARSRWRNPTAEHRNGDLGTHLSALESALGAIAAITGAIRSLLGVHRQQQLITRSSGRKYKQCCRSHGLGTLD